jgi:nucleotide-binding universal stress UspA family protein
MNRILIATDGSDHAARAFRVAVQIAQQFSAELLIVTVEQGALREGTEEFPETENPTVEEVLFAGSRQILQQAEEAAASDGISKTRSFSGLGDAASFILEVAEQERPDMIVVGRRGRGRLAGLLLGSVSQKLASLAPCGVLVVP